MITNVAAAGFQSAQITKVIVSHFHPDHVFGLMSKAPHTRPSTAHIGGRFRCIIFGRPISCLSTIIGASSRLVSAPTLLPCPAMLVGWAKRPLVKRELQPGRPWSVSKRHHFVWFLNYPAVFFGPEFLRLCIDCLSNAHDSSEGTVCL